MELRSEHASDRPAILELTGRAFATDDGANPPVEVGLLAELFECDGYLPGLSIVAADAGMVVGHSITTRGFIGDQPALGLGPISVLPERQRQGIGAALLEETRIRAEGMGESVIVLLGHTTYYPRFGYRPASELGIQAPDPQWGDYFMALPLGGREVPVGTFRYAEPFARL
ncbi:GNAT family N-acetyltransferase [Crystallibacter degradans]|uniref:GNAT family N-acetyltransferase n=1 Tax=Crystallibacter degradans TaxID=2726743 RepID=UPI0014765417|nr:N-acetyltransferase [Arthrobacter sp. SF27]NMR28320.1 N-acetyltransferase [Arthrobacter sp. SF27]